MSAAYGILGIDYLVDRQGRKFASEQIRKTSNRSYIFDKDEELPIRAPQDRNDFIGICKIIKISVLITYIFDIFLISFNIYIYSVISTMPVFKYFFHCLISMISSSRSRISVKLWLLISYPSYIISHISSYRNPAINRIRSTHPWYVYFSIFAIMNIFIIIMIIWNLLITLCLDIIIFILLINNKK